MLLVDVEELRNGHAHLVRTPHQVSLALGKLVLQTLGRLVVADCLSDRVWDLGEGLLVFLENELLLLDLNLLGLVDLAFDDDRLDHKWHDEPFDRVLLFVVDLDAHVGAGLYLISGQQGVGAELVPLDRPKVGEYKHSIYCDRQDEADRRQQVLLVEHAQSERKEDT